MHINKIDPIHRIQKLATSGNAEAAWRLACGYFDGCLFSDDGIRIPLRKNSRVALSWLKKAAVLGSSDAMVDLAGQLSSGALCDIDLQQALEWEKKAFELGNENAAHNLAITCSLMSKQKECYRWLQKSVEGGREGSLLLVGVCLYLGYGVRCNISRALITFRHAYKSDQTWDDDRVKALKFISMIAHERSPSYEGNISEVKPEAFYDDLALRIYRHERRVARNNLASSFCLGETLLRTNQAKRAISYLHQCFTRDFCKYESMILLAEIYQLLEMSAEEMRLYQSWLIDHPRDGFILGNLGAVYIDQGRFMDSLEASSRAVPLVKGDKRWIRRNIIEAKSGLD